MQQQRVKNSSIDQISSVNFPLLDEQKTNKLDSKQRGLGRQSFGTNLVDPYYAFNPDYMGGNMPALQSYQSSVPDLTRPSTCRCSCADISYAPQISCIHPQQCVMACLQMYGGQCTIINTYGCCGSSCQYFQSQSLTNRYCTCNCAGQQYYNPVDTCSSAQSCLTRCTDSFFSSLSTNGDPSLLWIRLYVLFSSCSHFMCLYMSG